MFSAVCFVALLTGTGSKPRGLTKTVFKEGSSSLTNADWLRAAGLLEEDHR